MVNGTKQAGSRLEDLERDIAAASTFADLESPLVALNRLSLNRTERNPDQSRLIASIANKIGVFVRNGSGGPLLVELLLVAPIADRLGCQLPDQEIWINLSKSLHQPLLASKRYTIDEILPWLFFTSLAKGCTEALCDLIRLPGVFEIDSTSHVRPSLVQKVLSTGQWLHEIDVDRLSHALRERVDQFRQEYQVNHFLSLNNFLSNVFPFTRDQSTEILHAFFSTSSPSSLI